MKKIGFVALTVLLLVLLCAIGVSAATTETGNVNVLADYEVTAVPEDATPITSAVEFAAMEADGVYYLDADISLTFTYGDFAGKLYGNGHSITTTKPVFDTLNGAEVYDLTLKGDVSEAASHVGALAYKVYGSTLQGVVNMANVANTGNVNNNMLAGGLAGYAENTTVRYCVNYGTITCGSNLGQARPGGLIGEINNAEAWLVIENCVNYGDINGINQTGGILARAQNCSAITIKSCVNYGTVYVGSSDTGAIAAKLVCAGTATVENCINSGRIDGGSQAGIVGYGDCNELYITNCHNGCFLGCTTDCEHGYMSSQSGNLGSMLGGYYSAGRADSILVISGCTNTGDLKGGNHTGGIAGNVTAKHLTIENCTNSGNVTAAGAVAGMVALVSDDTAAGIDATLRNCVNVGKLKTTNGVGSGMIAYCDVSGTALLENCFNGCQSGCTASCEHGKLECTSHGAGMIGSRCQAGSTTIVRSCTNTGRLVCGGYSSAGIVGWSNSEYLEITDCFNGCKNGCESCDHGVISLTGANNLAGIVACINGNGESKTVLIRNCTNTADLSTGSITGGIVAGCWAADSITIENCTNTGDMTANDNDIGGIAGQIQPGGSATITVRNCHNEGNFSAANDGCDIGGIVGAMENGNGPTILVENCTNKGTFTTTNSGNATTRVGGIVGPVRGTTVTIKNCVNNGTLNIASYGAGIVARCQASEEFRIEGCINNGNVTSAREYASGIMGWTADNAKITVIDTHNKGDISCPGVAGGILGNWNNVATTMYFESCTNSGSLTGSTATNVGGIVAQITSANTTSVTFKNCHNSASLTSKQQNAAGIVGYINAETIVFENCSNGGNMEVLESSSYDDGAAGIVGFVYNGCTSLTIKNCSNTGNMTTVNCNAAGIIGRSFGKGALTISGCTNSGVITVTATDSGKNGNGDAKDCSAGGIAGMITDHSTLTYENCHNGCFSGCTTNCEHGRVINNAGRAGGIHGYNYGGWITLNFKNCSNSGYITSKWETGGIAGRVNVKILYVENCSNGCFNGCTPAAGEYCTHGMVTNTATADFGGIIGICDHDKCISITLKNCYNNGYLNGTNRGGGMAGALEVNGSKVGSDQTATVLIENCVNEGVVKSGSYAGGMSPRVDAVRSNSAAIFRNCINRGDLIPASYAGGMMAWCRNDQDTDGSEIDVLGTYLFENCYNYGDITAASNASGIMANMGGGDVQSLTLINCHNSGNITGAGEVAAGLVGWGGANLVIKNCSNSGTIISGALNAPKSLAGGLVAQNTRQSVIMDSTNTGVVSGTYVGGIIAYHNNDEPLEIINCSNSASITGTQWTGGIIGRSASGNDNQRIIGCSNSGTITYNGSGDCSVGGIIGELTDGNGSLYFESCTNSGSVTVSSVKNKGYVGGIIGCTSGSVTVVDCTNSGNLSLTVVPDSECTCEIGGLIGVISGDLDVDNFLNTGAISGTADDQWNAAAGGFIGAVRGACDATIKNSVNRGKVTHANGAAAGMIGFRHGNNDTMISLINCKNYGEIEAAKRYASGGIGYAYKAFEFIGCENHGKVTSKGNNAAGGLFGRKEAYTQEYGVSFIDCLNTGAVKGSPAGGIACDIESGAFGDFINCVNEGTVTGGRAAGILCEWNGYVKKSGDNYVYSGPVRFINCVNKATGVINGTGIAAGIAAAVNECKLNGTGGNGEPAAEYYVGPDVTVVFSGCSNEATVNGTYAGGINGVVDNSVSVAAIDCHNTGAITGNNRSGGISGKFVANVSLTVSNCTNTGDITMTGNGNGGVGGILGEWCGTSDALFENCTNEGDVTDVVKARLGGILGVADWGSAGNGVFRNCVNKGDVTSNGNYAAGIACRVDLAANKTLTFDNCTNEGDVTAKTNHNGGIIGLMGGGRAGTVLIVKNCTNEGNVTSKSAGDVGGIVGRNDAHVLNVINCINRGTIKATSKGNTAGIVGYIVEKRTGMQTVSNCSNYGKIEGGASGWGYAAGVVACCCSNLTIENCYNGCDQGCTAACDHGYVGCHNGAIGGMLGKKQLVSDDTTNYTLTVKNCVNDGRIGFANKAYYAGGIVGETAGYGNALTMTITNCVNNGKVLAHGGQIGGIIARSYAKNTVSDCTNNGEIVDTNDGIAAGIWGRQGTCAVNITNCTNNGNVTANTGAAGGITGELHGDGGTVHRLTGCVNTGNVTSAVKAGGLAGHAQQRIVVQKGVNTGNVTAGQWAAGICACAFGQFSTFEYCHVSGTITNTLAKCGTSEKSPQYGAAGLVAYANGVTYMNYNVIEANLVAKYNDNAYSTMNRNVAVLCCYANNVGHQAKYNVFLGTMDAGTYGKKVYVTYVNTDAVFTEFVDGGITKGLNKHSSWGEVDTSNNIYGNYSVVDMAMAICPTAAEASTYQAVGKPILLTGDDAANVSTVNTAYGSELLTVSGGKVMPKSTATATAPHTHSFSTTLTQGDHAHWYACACGATKDYAVHDYTNACDTACNTCGKTRTVPAHSYLGDCDATCEICGASRETETAHTYTNACDTTCNVCSATRTVSSHVYSGDCDADCNRCGATRTATGTHAGEHACSTACKVCGAAVTPDAHTYSNSCDSTCDKCGAVRTEGLVHVGAYACSTTCKFCQTAIEATGAHVGAYACAVECKLCHATIEATGDHVYSTSCDLNCDKCGNVRTEGLVHAYTNDCDIACDNCGYVRAESELTHTWAEPCSTACDVCGKTIEAQQPHTGAYSCATACQWCGTEIEPGQHTPAEACSEICKDCGAAVPVEQAHSFANDCDPDCDLCGKPREVTENMHTFANDCDKVCEYCDFTRDDSELKHTFANNCDASCEYCDFTREITEDMHTYPYPCADKCLYCETDLVPGDHTHEFVCSNKCYHCGESIEAMNEHAYSGVCDLICNNCGAERAEEAAHQYHSDCDVTCNVCGYERSVDTAHAGKYPCSTTCMYCGATVFPLARHDYASACDADCDVCGRIRTFAEGLEAHAYDNLCDATCNNEGCSVVRPVGNHKGMYACSTVCKHCGAEIEGKDHVYSSDCDDTCGYCGEVTRTVDSHEGEFACSTVCKLCGATIEGAEHTYDNACDADCNVCGETRTVGAHEGEFACSTVCKYCGAAIEGAEHTYENACDADCNVCGATRTPADHVYDSDCDADCGVCGAVRDELNHTYDNACDADCNVCGAPRTPADHVYDNDADADCNVCGAVREIEEGGSDEPDDTQPGDGDNTPDDSQPDDGNSGNTDNAPSTDAPVAEESNTTTYVIIAIVIGVIVVIVLVAVAGKRSKKNAKGKNSKGKNSKGKNRKGKSNKGKKSK